MVREQPAVTDRRPGADGAASVGVVLRRRETQARNVARPSRGPIPPRSPFRRTPTPDPRRNDRKPGAKYNSEYNRRLRHRNDRRQKSAVYPVAHDPLRSKTKKSGRSVNCGTSQPVPRGASPGRITLLCFCRAAAGQARAYLGAASLKRTACLPPFSAMNSTPADSRAAPSAARLFLIGTDLPASVQIANRRLADLRRGGQNRLPWLQPTSARAARQIADVIPVMAPL